MIQRPPSLKTGDLIVLVAPAKAIETTHVHFAQDFLHKAGFRVEISAHCLGSDHYFSGPLDTRLADFQWALDHPEAKAILCARGGYGCVQLVDLLDWTAFQKNPKWIIGFSDVTVFHQRIHRLKIGSVHGSMPLNFSENSPEALLTLLTALSGQAYSIASPPHPLQIEGSAKGELIGGNLSILYALLGTNDRVDYRGKILFIEDVGEHLYALDRMCYALKKAGVLKEIAGLVVGGMTDMKDTAVPFGKSLEEILHAHTLPYSIPMCFDFPAGHLSDNRALRFGDAVRLSVRAKGNLLEFPA
jgi:muramoyltetrapeptide carboxypeptidase